MKYIIALFISVTLSASELQLLLQSSNERPSHTALHYTPKSYAEILNSKTHFEYLQKQDSTQLRKYFETVLHDIREDKTKLYQDECGTPCKKCQSGSIISIAAGSPFALLAGWLTHNFCITLSGGIGTFIYLPAVGYYVYKVCSEYEKLTCYETAILQWQMHLLPYNYPIEKKMQLTRE